jgi:hypothetical protein
MNRRWKLVNRVVILGGALLLSGCNTFTNAFKKTSQETLDVAGPTPHRNKTPMTQALACLARAAPSGAFRMGVSEFVDGTGSIEGGAQNSRTFSQRPDYMMIVGLKAAGVNLVNRSSVNVAEWELKQAMEQKLGDGRPTMVENQSVLFRPVPAGVFLGSTHYVTGAVTEMNWNIDSKVAEGSVLGAGAGGRTYRISMAVDVMLTNTLTTEVVHARSYKKQVVGYEVMTGVFRFMEDHQAVAYGLSGLLVNKSLELFQANLGDKQNEPIQAALRWVIELSAYDLIRSMTKRGRECDALLPAGSTEPDLPNGGIGPVAEAASMRPLSAAPPFGPTAMKPTVPLPALAEASVRRSIRASQSIAGEFPAETSRGGSRSSSTPIAQRIRQSLSPGQLPSQEPAHSVAAMTTVPISRQIRPSGNPALATLVTSPGGSAK